MPNARASHPRMQRIIEWSEHVTRLSERARRVVEYLSQKWAELDSGEHMAWPDDNVRDAYPPDVDLAIQQCLGVRVVAGSEHVVRAYDNLPPDMAALFVRFEWIDADLRYVIKAEDELRALKRKRDEHYRMLGATQARIDALEDEFQSRVVGPAQLAAVVAAAAISCVEAPPSVPVPSSPDAADRHTRAQRKRRLERI